MSSPARTSTRTERVDAAWLVAAFGVCGSATVATLLPAFAAVRGMLGASASIAGLVVLGRAVWHLSTGRWAITARDQQN